MNNNKKRIQHDFRMKLNDIEFPISTLYEMLENNSHDIEEMKNFASISLKSCKDLLDFYDTDVLPVIEKYNKNNVSHDIPSIHHDDMTTREELQNNACFSSDKTHTHISQESNECLVTNDMKKNNHSAHENIQQEQQTPYSQEKVHHDDDIQNNYDSLKSYHESYHGDDSNEQKIQDQNNIHNNIQQQNDEYHTKEDGYSKIEIPSLSSLPQRTDQNTHHIHSNAYHHNDEKLYQKNPDASKEEEKSVNLSATQKQPIDSSSLYFKKNSSHENTDKSTENNDVTILIVEDNPNNALILHSILNKKGYVCHEAFNAHDGMNYVLHNTYSLILMDIVLPDDTGINLIKKIRESTSNNNCTTPIIVITGFCDEASVGNIYSSGANDHIEKPYRRNHIISMIDTWASSDISNTHHPLSSFIKILEEHSINDINDHIKIINQIKAGYREIMDFIIHDKTLRNSDIENIIKDTFVWSDSKKSHAVSQYFLHAYCKKFQESVYDKHEINKILFSMHKTIMIINKHIHSKSHNNDK